MRGTLRFIDEDLPRAFGDLNDLHLLGDLADASTEAAAAIGAYIDYLERDLAPRSKGSFRLGRDRFEQKFRLDEGIVLDADRLLAIATRELQHTQDEFRRVASRLNGGDPLAAWARTKDDHPPAGQLIPVAQQQLADLVEFINKQRIVTIPNGAPVEVKPTPRFYRWTFASMVAAAFLASGGLNAGTPLETASTPVIAVQPFEKAVNSRKSVNVSPAGWMDWVAAIGWIDPLIARQAPSAIKPSRLTTNMQAFLARSRECSLLPQGQGQ